MNKPLPELRCSECGASTTAGCYCDAPYLTKEQYAIREILKEPEEMSNRTLSEKYGVSKDTVRRARKQVAQDAPPAKRKGKDGKSYPAKRKKTRPVEVVEAPLDVQFEYFLSNLAQHSVTIKETMTEKFGNWQSYPITHCTYELIQQAAGVWNELASRYKHHPPPTVVVNLKANGGHHANQYQK